MSARKQTATLLDSNVLVALTDSAHLHHEPATQWFARSQRPFATCPITQGALVRLRMQIGGATMPEAQALLQALIAHPLHRFWPDAIGYEAVRASGVTGHRQVTDAYLAELARQQGGKLATFDAGLAALHPDVAELL